MTSVLNSVAPCRKESPISLLLVTTCGFGDPKSTVSTSCAEQSWSTVRVAAWRQIVPLTNVCIAKWFVLPAAKALRFVWLRNRSGDSRAQSVTEYIMKGTAHLETNCPSGYYLLYYNRNVRHYSVVSAAVDMLLMDWSLFHIVFCEVLFRYTCCLP
jgi:hypothetical protein